jgi:hypothetical protein
VADVTPDDRMLAPGPELAWRNRQLIAARAHWPDGALEACEQIEKARPDWCPGWRAANTIAGFEAPAGYYGIRREADRGEPAAYGATAEALMAAIEARVSECPACGARLPVRSGSRIPEHQAHGSADPCRFKWHQETIDAL